MKIALGSDHHGTDAVAGLERALPRLGHEVRVLGPSCDDGCDYPDAAYAVATAVRDGAADMGILICGSGIGMCMVANKVNGVRAGLAVDRHAAEMTRRHNNANVLCLSGDRHSTDEVIAIAQAFLGAKFEGGRHARRVDKIKAIERGLDPTSAPCESGTA
ncbi:MAG: RpiB/LacA/LacB family sugar-phosphate isomerase [Phycisphaerales bacterium]|nr:RpiB/LacA/LacB family sugar-phosphate isomerase [Phycisphaerae bacterium]NNF44082.1 RpiB/LacA/LacB family sugar-phosphate isomerase [Phycisphaerales bacterium]NNM26499.1 RpiB/LacA/LacB family sugar-phosphate isomerase [Phycisphaerales bacterium]